MMRDVHGIGLESNIFAENFFSENLIRWIIHFWAGRSKNDAT